ncbi:MAG: hypothetical protein ABSE99_00625 [Terracidiphilus sp.]|jgi:hypothetical protein
MKVNCRLAALLACGIAFSAWGQQSAPPHSAGGAQSLAATMQIVQIELSEIGKLHFVVHVFDKEEGNGASPYIAEIGRVVADPASCTIRYHWWRSMHGEVVNDEDVSLSLHDVLGLSMLTNEQHEKQVFEKEKTSPDEKQTSFTKWDPPLFMVVMRTAGDNEEGFLLADEKKAARLAKDLKHAVELCGGKNVPF